MIFRNCFSASSMPAAVQRSAISPDDQCFTLRWVRRTISSIDSHGFVLSRVRLSDPVTPSRVRVRGLFHPFAQRGSGTGVRSVELAGELAELVERARVVVERPGSPQSLLHTWPLALGQMVKHVALLVSHTPLHQRLAEDV